MKTEHHTCKDIIDKKLQYAGWNLTDRTQVIEEFDIESHQFSDYVLLGKDGKPLAVIEAKKTSVDAAICREQAKPMLKNDSQLKKILLLLLLLCLKNISFGQRVTITMDSLSHVINTTKEDTARINALNALSKMLWRAGDFEKAMENAKAALALGEKINFKKGVATAYNNIGATYIKQTNYTEGLKNYSISLNIRLEMNDKRAGGSSYINIGNAYIQEDNYPEALRNYLNALKIGEEIRDTGLITNAYNSIGNVYDQQGNYADALRNYNAALKITEYTNPNSAAMSYVNIGDVYSKQGNYDEALKSFLKVLELQNTEFGDIQLRSVSYGNIGNVYMHQGKYAEALKNYLVALEIQEKMGYKYDIADSYINLGKIYLKLDKKNEAKDYLDKGLSLAKENESKVEMKDAYKGLCDLESATGNINKAFQYHLLYSAMKDSITNEESNKQISQLKIQYETEKKDKEIKTQGLQLTNKTLENRILETSIIISLMVIGIILLLSYLSYLRNKRKKKEYEHMLTDLELTVLKSQLNPHFISNSLSAINNFIDEQPSEASQFLVKFARLMRRVLEQNELPLISLKEELETIELYMQIESLRLRYGFDYHFEIDSSLDTELIKVPPLILQPTIENALWHGLATKSEKGYIFIKIKMENDLLKFTIEDNGSGKGGKTFKNSISFTKKKSYGVAITRKRIEILSKEMKKNGYYNLIFLEGTTITEMGLPVNFI